MHYKKIKLRFKEDVEPQEVLLDSLAQKKERELGISEKKFEVPLSRRAILALASVFVILLLSLFGKTFSLQILEAKKFSQLAEENRLRIYLSRPTRGVIYDSSGEQLVFNEPSFDLVLDKRDLPSSKAEKETVLSEVSKIIKKNLDELEKEIDESREQKILISENISHQTLLALETQISQKELPGFQIEQNPIRNYKEGQNFSHLIGYIGKINQAEYEKHKDSYNYSNTDYIGKSGVERSYEEILRGKSGILKVYKDALGNKKSEIKISDPEPGKSLVLWLDGELQKKIITELSSMLWQIGAKKGAAVAISPKTGGVLAMVSLPGFDNNLFRKGADPEVINKLLQDPIEPLFNRVISGTYLTGSTIKPLIATAALEEKIITPEKKINDNLGYIEVPHQYDPEIIYYFRDWTIHGWTDLRKAIAQSCNVYFYTVGGGYGDQNGLGPTRIKKYLELFGWGQKTGVDLPGEVEGFIPDKEWKKRTLGENWWDGDTYYLSIGQQYLQITPLEVVNSFLAIANGGTLYQPQIVKEIVDSEKKVIEELKPKIIRENFIDPQNLQIVREGMRQAVTAGSATGFLDSLPVTTAAKTGTAELGGDHYNNWVTVFAPYDDPQIVLTIVLEDVKGVQAAALPVARGVLDWYFTR